MSDLAIQVSGTKRLLTKGKFCDKNIVVTAQGDNHYDIFWDSLQQNGNQKEYVSTFGYGWNDDIFKPKYDLKPENAATMFEKSNIVDLKGDLERAGVKLDLSAVNYGRFVQMFMDSKIKYVGEVDTRGSASTIINYLFYNATNLVSVDKWIMTEDGNQKFGETTTFPGCLSLREIRLEGLLGCSLSFKSCSLLSNDSVQSILDHLKDLTGEAAQTLTFHATVGGNMTDAQKAVITAKNWTLVY